MLAPPFQNIPPAITSIPTPPAKSTREKKNDFDGTMQFKKCISFLQKIKLACSIDTLLHYSKYDKIGNTGL